MQLTVVDAKIEKSEHKERRTAAEAGGSRSGAITFRVSRTFLSLCTVQQRLFSTYSSAAAAAAAAACRPIGCSGCDDGDGHRLRVGGTRAGGAVYCAEARRRHARATQRSALSLDGLVGHTLDMRGADRSLVDCDPLSLRVR